jgi:hypothetical protein
MVAAAETARWLGAQRRNIEVSGSLCAAQGVVHPSDGEGRGQVAAGGRLAVPLGLDVGLMGQWAFLV